MHTVHFLKELHDSALDYAKRLQFDKTHIVHFTLVSLYGSLIELTGCMLTLLENRGKSGIPSIYRTFLETHVEFNNLLREPMYVFHMKASYLKELIKICRAVAEGGNPLLPSIANMPGLSDRVEKMERELKDLKSKGYKPLTIRERFERADMVEVYRSIYHFLSADCHSEIGALFGRHFEPGNDDFALVLYKNPPDEKLALYLETIAAFLVADTIAIHENLQSDAVNEVRSLKEKLAKLAEVRLSLLGVPKAAERT